MALKRADIRTILENTETSNDDKAKAILDALHKETDDLKDQLDAEKTARTQAEKERDEANGGKQAAEKALTDYKAQQTQKDTHAAKEAKFRELLKTAGVLDKYADRVVRLSGEDIDKLELDAVLRVSDVDSVELDEKGNVKDAKKHTDSLKADWGDFVATTTTTGAKVDNPPTNNSGVSLEDFRKMSLDDRIKFKAENPDLYSEYRGK